MYRKRSIRPIFALVPHLKHQNAKVVFFLEMPYRKTKYINSFAKGKLKFYYIKERILQAHLILDIYTME